MSSVDTAPEEDDDDAPLTDGAPPPPKPESRMMLWAGAVFGVTIACLLMLAARAESPPPMRPFFDIALFTIVVGSAAFGIVRFLFMFPFRLADLLLIVLALGIGMKATVETVNWLRQGVDAAGADPLAGARLSNVSAWLVYVEACMIVACVFMAGAALGLRNCRMMDVQSPIKRAIVILLGIAGIPAPLALIALPIVLLKLLISPQPSGSMILALFVALMVSLAVTVTNTLFSVRTMTHTTENSTRETKWRE